MNTIIAADIGGTNCRFGLFWLDGDIMELKRSFWIDTTSLTCTEELIRAADQEFDLENSDVLVIAIAGPVEGNVRGKLSNGTLTLDMESHRGHHGKLELSLINDFMAQAWAIPSIVGQNSLSITGPQDFPRATRAILGAGTGLGYSIIPLMENGTWEPVPSENGHVGFPFITEDEHRFEKHICGALGIPYATGDDVLSGRGLAILHEFLTGQHLSPKEVGNSFLNSDTETLAWYAKFYGRACRNWILTTLCHGGLWIAGGIAGQNPYCLENNYFIDELYASNRWSHLLRTIPVRLMADQNSGLWGAACFGKKLCQNAANGKE